MGCGGEPWLVAVGAALCALAMVLRSHMAACSVVGGGPLRWCSCRAGVLERGCTEWAVCQVQPWAAGGEPWAHRVDVQVALRTRVVTLCITRLCAVCRRRTVNVVWPQRRCDGALAHGVAVGCGR